MPAPITKSTDQQGQSLTKYIPILLVLLALVLRLWGITWALPDATRAYSYHVDESVVVGHALDLDPLKGRVEPNFYNYGSLALLLDGFVLHAGQATGMVVSNPPEFRPGGLAVPSASELLTARLLTALFGAGTVGFLYGCGRLLYGRAAGIVAALGYAVAPLAVQHGHFATVDGEAIFWIVGALYFAVKATTVQNEVTPVLAVAALRKYLFLTGLFAGLAAATKYNCGLIVFSGIAAWWLAKPRQPLSLGGLFAGTLLGFIVGCPGIFLNPSALIRDIKFEANHVATGHGQVYIDTMSGFLYHIFINLRWGLTIPLLMICLFSIGVAAVRRRPTDLLLAAFALPYYVLIGLAAVKFARYTLPLFPPLFLFAGAAWDGWRNLRGQMLYRVFAACAGISALGFSIALNQAMTRTDPRDQAAAYIRSLSTVQSVGFPAGPWYYSPTLSPYLTHPYPPIAQEAALQSDKQRLIPSVVFGPDGQPARTVKGALDSVEWSTPLLTSPTEPDAIAFGELHYDDYLRTRFAPAEAYLQAAAAQYPNRKNFTNPVTLFGLPLVPVYSLPGEPRYGLPTQPLPHDMLYTNSSVSVWTR